MNTNEEVQRTLDAIAKLECSICGVDCTNINHDAQPVKPGERCCPDCNIMVVIPTKLNVLTSGVLYDIDNMEMKDE